MSAKAPSPALRAPSPTRGEGNNLSASSSSLTKGEGDNHLVPSTMPSPLVGEGGDARSAVTGEGAAGRTLRFAKQLRRTMTDAETRLWHELRAKRFERYKFKWQVPIGRYIADFVCFDLKLIVEIDGSQHEGSATDVVRDHWLSAQGFRVLRLWNREVLLDTNGAMLSILAALEESKTP